MLLLKILILVWTLRLVALHTGFSMAKAWLALLILVLTSWSQSPVIVTLVAKYVNSSTFSRCFSLIQTGSLTLVNFGLLCVDCFANTFSFLYNV